MLMCLVTTTFGTDVAMSADVGYPCAHFPRSRSPGAIRILLWPRHLQHAVLAW